MISKDDEVLESDANNKVLIFDDMALVNQMNKIKEIKTCQDFADRFVRNVVIACEGYGEVRMVFDRYLEASLKDLTRQKRNQGERTQYKIKKDTNIEDITMKMLLHMFRQNTS